MIKKCVVCGKEFDARTTTKTCSEECRKTHARAYNKKWKQTPESKAYEKVRSQERRRTLKWKTYDRERKRSPKYKAYKRKYAMAYNQTSKHKAYAKAYRQEHKAYAKAYMRAYYQNAVLLRQDFAIQTLLNLGIQKGIITNETDNCGQQPG